MKRIFKFIPNHYKGGDIILTRQDEKDEWKIDVFSHILAKINEKRSKSFN